MSDAAGDRRHVLVLNCGSSSVKSALIELPGGRRVRDIRVTGVGTSQCRLRIDGQEQALDGAVDLDAAVERVLQEHQRRRGQVEFLAVGHRIVHGGAEYVEPAVIDDEVHRRISAIKLAPLHNPPALAAVRRARELLGALPHIAVFDTAFHRTLPPRAREYALPADLRAAQGIRRYGFHGISHAGVAARVAEQLDSAPDRLRIVSCHLGNGASVAAIEYGRCVETSMGMTPLEGLVMGTRAGDLDPGVLLHLLESGMSADDLSRLLNKESGLAGITGTQDMADIERRAAAGDEAARLAMGLYAHRIRKYIGAYAAVMGGVDVIAFTGGVGENSAAIRHRCLQRLDFLGASIDEDRNRDLRLGDDTPQADISGDTSRVRLWVVRADEEREIATQSADLLARQARQLPEWVSIPVAVSARHAHLSEATIGQLFGAGFHLQPRSALSQPGQFAAEQTVALIGPRGRIDQVRVLGPPRAQDQVEISRTDEFTLGIDAPVRLSGDLANSPGVTLEGPAGRVTLAQGVICARRHVHMNTADAERLGLRDRDEVSVRIAGEREVTYGDVTVRVSPEFRLELHLDTDEANAAGVCPGVQAKLLLSPRRTA